MCVIVFGPHGAGKGTQSLMIAGKYNLVRISTGELIREHMQKNTEFGRKCKEYMTANKYVPDEIIDPVIEENLKGINYKKCFVLDGYPRTLGQAKFLDDIMLKLGIKLDVVINLQVNHAELVRRMMKRAVEQKRLEDTEEGIKSRMKEYETKAEPVIEYYRSEGKLVDINGDQPVEKVFEDIKQVLDKLIE